MKIGLVYPQIEFGSDPVVIRDYAQTAEALGYDFIVAYDHVLGANPDRPGGWQGPYTYQNPFHDPFVMFSYMAGLTQRIEFATGILILPQRETAVVAKQAATLDLLCDGRFRLGVGNGWNKVEFIALNQDFHTRGRRIEEQVQLLRRLWTEELITYEGRWHTIPDAGLNPRPARRIPIWFGGAADAVLRRIARLGDGWMSNARRAAEAQADMEKIYKYAERYGRTPDEFGLEGRLSYKGANPDLWRRLLGEWEAVGATHMSLNTMYLGFDTPQKHLDAITHFAETTINN